MLWEILLCGALVAVLAAMGCLIRKRLLLPLKASDTVLLLPARVSGDDLEQRLRACRLLQRWGLLEGAPVLLDLGLNDEGRTLAERLADAFDAALCTPDELHLLPLEAALPHEFAQPGIRNDCILSQAYSTRQSRLYENSEKERTPWTMN